MRQGHKSLDDRATLAEQCSRSSKSRASQKTLNALAKRIMIAAVFLLACVPVNAGPGMDWGTCCMQAAREQFSDTDPQNPWDLCGVDPDFDFEGHSDPSPSVNASLGWCKHHCPGYQKSSAEQWLQPLSTWVIPALALLILCSVGEAGRGKKEKWPFYTACYQVKEYIALLGDLASAICGAFSELWMDALMAERLAKVEGKSIQVVIGVAMLASQTEFDSSDAAYIFGPQPTKIKKKDIVGNPKETFQKRRSISQGEEQSEANASSAELRARAAIKDPLLTTKLQTGIKTVLKARADFVNGVIVPVVLMLASTGSSFHDAYLKLGANDSAHGLAYGV